MTESSRISFVRQSRQSFRGFFPRNRLSEFVIMLILDIPSVVRDDSESSARRVECDECEEERGGGYPASA